MGKILPDDMTMHEFLHPDKYPPRRSELSASPACSTLYLLALKPAYAAARGMFSRSEHKGYTSSLDEAGRFSEVEALEAQSAMPDKYVAIPVKA